MSCLCANCNFVCSSQMAKIEKPLPYHNIAKRLVLIQFGLFRSARTATGQATSTWKCFFLPFWIVFESRLFTDCSQQSDSISCGTLSTLLRTTSDHGLRLISKLRTTSPRYSARSWSSIHSQQLQLIWNDPQCAQTSTINSLSALAQTSESKPR